MNKYERMPEDVSGAFERMQLINRQLDQDSMDLESQASLVDERINLDMGLGAFRPSMSKGVLKVDEKSKTQENPKSEKD